MKPGAGTHLLYNHGLLVSVVPTGVLSWLDLDNATGVRLVIGEMKH